MAILVVTSDDKGNLSRVEYVTDTTLTHDASKFVKQVTTDVINKPQSGLSGGYDGITIQVFNLSHIKDAIQASPILTPEQKAQFEAERAKFQVGDIIRYGVFDPKTKTVRARETYNPPIRKVIKFNDP